MIFSSSVIGFSALMHVLSTQIYLLFIFAALLYFWTAGEWKQRMKWAEERRTFTFCVDLLMWTVTSKVKDQKYLGVQMSGSLSSLYTTDLSPLLNEIKVDFSRWRSLLLSLIGPIQSVKINVLLEVLRSFQRLPVFLPKTVCSFSESNNQRFIWGGKHPRMNQTLLWSNKETGGLAPPTFIHHYWAANIQKISLWLHTAQSSWSCSLPASVFSWLPVTPSPHTSNPRGLSTFKIWIQLQNHYKFKAASGSGPVSNKHLFPPSTLDSTFSQWKAAGLRCLRDLFLRHIFPRRDDGRQKHHLAAFNMFRSLQMVCFSSSTTCEWKHVKLWPPCSQSFHIILIWEPLHPGKENQIILGGRSRRWAHRWLLGESTKACRLLFIMCSTSTHSTEAFTHNPWE